MIVAGYPPPPSTPEPMSQAAAASMVEAAGTIRAAVLRLVERFEPITAEQIEELLDMRSQTITPRLWELCKAGKIEKLKGAHGRTRSGRACNFYVVAKPVRTTLFDWPEPT